MFTTYQDYQKCYHPILFYSLLFISIIRSKGSKNLAELWLLSLLHCSLWYKCNLWTISDKCIIYKTYHHLFLYYSIWHFIMYLHNRFKGIQLWFNYAFVGVYSFWFIELLKIIGQDQTRFENNGLFWLDIWFWKGKKGSKCKSQKDYLMHYYMKWRWHWKWQVCFIYF